MRAQIVHIHTCALFAFWRDIFHMLASRALGCQVVWHIHDGTFPSFVRQGPALKRWVIRRALRMAKGTIVLSEYSLRQLRPLVAKVNWRVVPNGVPMPRIAPRPATGPATFLFLGQLTRRKGVADLIEAVRLGLADGFDGSVGLAGAEAKAGQEAQVRRHIAEAGCSRHVELLGVVSGRRKDEALRQARCLVLPSYAEGLPMAILEAMSHGLAVIATRIGTIPEVISHGREGFLIEPGDVKGLAEYMTRIARDPALAARMGAAARRRVEDGYSVDHMAAKLTGIYRDVLGQ